MVQSTRTQTPPDSPASFNVMDAQGNRYFVHQDVVEKFDNTGVLLFSYSNKSLGQIHSLDVSNLLRPILFYKNLQQVVITDNTLSAHSSQTIRFEDLNMYQIERVAASKMDNGIWLYDQATFQLLKLKQNLELLYQSGNLEQLLAINSIAPLFMIENNGYLFMACATNGILIFDMYGAYYKTIPVLTPNFIYLVDQVLYVVHDNETKIEAFHLQTLASAQLQLEQKITHIFGFYNNRFYGFQDGKVISSGFTVIEN